MGRIAFRKCGCETALGLALISVFLLEELNMPFS